MKNRIFVLIFFFAFSCETKTVETKPKDDIIIIPEDSETWENEERKLNEELAKNRQDFILTMKKKSFNFTCYDKCEGDVGINPEELKKYGKRKPFDIKRKVINDTLKIKFKFISDCCLEYIGDVEKKGDTLRLIYKNISNTPCDCYCYYYYEYFLPNNKYKSKFIYLGDSLITKNKK